ncbi:polyketide synthase dehydratase domain-containing protein, partial [Streptomyces sp. I05A-00742]|uniref:polyketide synthase dehydratase domain-containing protein n=1 Tax=Streptomyces sp. I05A-00742 TaxID=2732853 RepID=UPI0014896057
PHTTTVTGTLRRNDATLTRFLTNAAHTWTTGLPLTWTTLTPDSTPPLELPTYAFAHTRYWLDRSTRGGDLTGVGLADMDHGLVAAAVELAGSDAVMLSGRLSQSTHPWLADHAVAGTALLPGTAFVDLLIRAGDQVGCGVVQELIVQTPLIIPADGAVELQVVVEAPDSDGRRNAAVYSRPQSGTGAGSVWARHAQATLVSVEAGPAASDDDVVGLGVWPPVGAVPVVVEGAYEVLSGRGYGYGPAFRGLRGVWRGGEGELFVEAVLP